MENEMGETYSTHWTQVMYSAFWW